MINNFSENILTIKNKLNNTTIDTFLEKLSQRTIRYILKDLENINFDDQTQVQDNPDPVLNPEQDNLYIFTDGNCKKMEKSTL